MNKLIWRNEKNSYTDSQWWESKPFGNTKRLRASFKSSIWSSKDPNDRLLRNAQRYQRPPPNGHRLQHKAQNGFVLHHHCDNVPVNKLQPNPPNNGIDDVCLPPNLFQSQGGSPRGLFQLGRNELFQVTGCCLGAGNNPEISGITTVTANHTPSWPSDSLKNKFVHHLVSLNQK